MHGPLDGADIEAVHHLLAVVKHDHRHDITLPGLLPFFEIGLVVLNIAYLEGQRKLGEIPFRPGTVPSAVGHIDYDPFLGGNGELRRGRGSLRYCQGAEKGQQDSNSDEHGE